MLRNLTITAVTALAFAASAAFAAGGGEQHIEDYAFSFEGPFGKFDQNQLQRGLKVYTEVCAACHGLRYVPIRTLADAQTHPKESTRQVGGCANSSSSSHSFLGGCAKPSHPVNHSTRLGCQHKLYKLIEFSYKKSINKLMIKI